MACIQINASFIMKYNDVKNIHVNDRSFVFTLKYRYIWL